MLTIINDTHLGVRRSAGTTKESQAALSRFTLDRFDDLLTLADGGNLLINGDLFDRFEVDKLTEFEVFRMLVRWLRRNQSCRLFLAAGNHDLSRDSSRRSSFDNLCQYLRSFAPAQVVEINGELYCTDKWGVIPHMANQELFDAELEKALNVDIKHLFLHCNYDNNFAAQADHSLNLSAEQASKFAERGITLVLAHEHNKRRVGNVVIVGNQIATSVADLVNDHGDKQYAVLKDGELTLENFWPVSELYAAVDWQNELPEGAAFIRVEGEADYSQAAEVVERIAAWRKQSDAFVITNAVRVGTMDTGHLAEDVRSEKFDIWQALMAHLPDDLKPMAEELRND